MAQEEKYHIFFVLEGDEENMLFDIIKEQGTNPIFDLNFVNAHGFGNIGPYFQDEIAKEENDVVLAVYDVDDHKTTAFETVQTQLMDILGTQKRVDAVSICTNPNILQIILLGCDTLNNVTLTSSSKESNTPIVHKYWNDIGKEKVNEKGQDSTKLYKANHWQLEKIKGTFLCNETMYCSILENATALDLDFRNKLPGSNILPLLKSLKEGNMEYFKSIQKTCDE